MHTVRFPFSLPEGLSPNEALFLGQTPASCDSLPDSAIQLYGALRPGYSNEVTLFFVTIFQLERRKGHTDHSDKRCCLA